MSNASPKQVKNFNNRTFSINKLVQIDMLSISEQILNQFKNTDDRDEYEMHRGQTKTDF